MSRAARFVLFVLGGGCVALMFVLAFLAMPPFGHSDHPYRDLAVTAAVRHHTANVVAAVNFDQRTVDTFGEETILVAAAVGATVLLRPSSEQARRVPPDLGRTLELTRLTGYVLLPVTLVVGLDVVAHGHVTPGGGFQGGVVLATGLHLLYVTGSYSALDRLRPLSIYDGAEGLGAAAFAVVGLFGIVAAGSFLGNFLPLGVLGDLLSAGTVPILNIAVGVEVAGGIVVILAKFFDQEITLTEKGGP